jgi:hypothetical protein
LFCGSRCEACHCSGQDRAQGFAGLGDLLGLLGLHGISWFVAGISANKSDYIDLVEKRKGFAKIKAPLDML